MLLTVKISNQNALRDKIESMHFRYDGTVKKNYTKLLRKIGLSKEK